MCQAAPIDAQLDYVPSNSGSQGGDDDEDDFDEDEDDDDEPQQKKPKKMSKLAEVLCSMTPIANQKIKELVLP